MKNLLLLPLLSFAFSIFAEDALPPTWRGQAGTKTYFVSFTNSANPVLLPDLSVDLVPGAFTTGWWSSVLARDNIWDLAQGGYLTVTDPAPAVRVHLQVTYWDDDWNYITPPVIANDEIHDPIYITNTQYFVWGKWQTASYEWTQDSGLVVFDVGHSYPHGFVLSDLVLDVQSQPMLSEIDRPTEDF